MLLLEGNQTSKARDLAHLIFWIGTEALLDDSVANYLRSLGINAPTIGNKLPKSSIFVFAGAIAYYRR
jgi:hypothetical protein